MSSSVSSTTSQQQFVQVQQSAATKGNASSNANTQSAQTAQAAQTPPAPAQTVAGANGVPESKFRRNNDGTFGPGHTALPPFNPLKPSANNSTDVQALASADVGVNVKI